MIDRIISPAMLEAAKASPSRLLAFAEIETENGWARVHTGNGERKYTVDSEETYYGVGEFAGISTFTENSNNTGARTSLSLRVLDQTLLAELYNNSPIGYACYVHLVAFDENRRIIDGFNYAIDAEIVDLKVKRGDTEKQIPAVITIEVNDWMERWSSAPESPKTTDSAQQKMYPGDKFFNLVEIIAGSPLSSLPTKTTSVPRDINPLRGGVYQ